MEIPPRNKGGRPRLDETCYAVKKSISMSQAEWDKLCHYCQVQEWQPTISEVIRKAMEEFYEKRGL